MNELSLFTGAGGGLLGTHLLGWEAIGYVEWNEYCQQVIRARIDDGILPVAPIFTDVREFVKSGAAREYRGFADVVTGGFPCQPFSVAGKQQGADDPRNMWPAAIEVIRAVRPRFAFLENVPAILSSGYFGRILGDLAESGYDCRWRILSAAELGAPHRRDRAWLVAHRRGDGLEGEFEGGTEGWTVRRMGGESTGLDSLPMLRRLLMHYSLADARMGVRLPSTRGEGRERTFYYGPLFGSELWPSFDGPIRVVDGVDSRVDRLKAIGNGQTPVVAAMVWRLLTE